MTKLIPESHRSLVSRYIDIMRDRDVASNISLMSMFVGINDPEGSLNLPKCNYWVHAFFISFSSAKDPSYAYRHPGKHVALVIGPCCYDDVEQFKDKRVKHRGPEYTALKEQWQEVYMKTLLNLFPELEDKVDYVELGTAVTNDFYLGTHRGAVYGLAHTPKRFAQHWLRPKTPIANLFLSGQDVCACGIMDALGGGYMCAYAMSTRAMLRTLPLWAP
ncbi:hypothetical protein ACHAWF_011457 [Thalassiosira exigua]